VPTALCVHWLAFCGRRHGLNRSYPVPRLRYLIEGWCGIPCFSLPCDAVLAALTYQSGPNLAAFRRSTDGRPTSEA
jgi:hypothetical protein